VPNALYQYLNYMLNYMLKRVLKFGPVDCIVCEPVRDRDTGILIDLIDQ
jgi:hypothetical protein